MEERIVKAFESLSAQGKAEVLDFAEYVRAREALYASMEIPDGIPVIEGRKAPDGTTVFPPSVLEGWEWEDED